MTVQPTARHTSDVTDATFGSEVLGSDVPVLVDFWAEWCPPCHQVAPVLEKIAEERAGSVRVVKLNSDENPVTAARYRVMGLPTFLLFRDGAPVLQLTGARSKAAFDGELDKLLG